MEISTIYKIFEIVGLILGLFYLYYEYKADNKVWIFGILMPLISMCVYFSKGIYADFGINIYYLLAAVYGYTQWRGGKRNNNQRPITKFPRKQCLPVAVIFVIVWYAIYMILVNFTDSKVPIPDSFTTALSIVGLWALAKKYLEQWIIWLIVDMVSVGLYFYKDLYFYGTLYTAYSIIAVFGYLKWKKMMNHPAQF